LAVADFCLPNILFHEPDALEYTIIEFPVFSNLRRQLMEQGKKQGVKSQTACLLKFVLSSYELPGHGLDEFLLMGSDIKDKDIRRNGIDYFTLCYISINTSRNTAIV